MRSLFMPLISNLPFDPSSYWLDWLTVLGYIAFAGFIAWRVLMPRSDD